jgi:hypothetical protein
VLKPRAGRRRAPAKGARARQERAERASSTQSTADPAEGDKSAPDGAGRCPERVEMSRLVPGVCVPGVSLGGADGRRESVEMGADALHRGRGQGAHFHCFRLPFVAVARHHAPVDVQHPETGTRTFHLRKRGHVPASPEHVPATRPSRRPLPHVARVDTIGTIQEHCVARTGHRREPQWAAKPVSSCRAFRTT